jgi:hypothetical protein
MSDLLGSRDILYPANSDRFDKKVLFQQPQPFILTSAFSILISLVSAMNDLRAFDAAGRVARIHHQI